ncbi:MAG: DUF1972 domain-containing protein [Bacteroidetes bacterium]|nr:MAG: DUF1972 domain-containing protein [Bacteroidota bacterium]
MKRQVGIIGSVGVPGKYGGFETLAHHLSKGLVPRHPVQVYCSSKAYPPQTRQAVWEGVKLVYIPFDANGISSIPYDLLSLLHALFTCKVLVVLGVSGAPVLPLIRLFTRKRLIVNIDGLEWKRDKWGRFAKAYLKAAERIAVFSAHEIIADNQGIQAHVLEAYGKSSRLIEYGGDHALPVAANDSDREAYPFLSAPYAFKVCRIEPENNIGMVLEAFATQQKLPLVMIGNWNNSEYGSALKAKYSNYSHLHLLDPIYEPRTLNMIRSGAYVYVHGHMAGGTNPSLVEAMSLRLPIIAFDVLYNRATTEDQALYFTDVNSLHDLLQQLSDQQLQQIREQMTEIATRRYTWQTIVAKYEALISHP